MGHRDEILGRYVSRGALRHRATSELAEGALERRDAGFERGEHVCETLPARVVEVSGELDAVESLGGSLEEFTDLDRVRHPGRVAECDLLAAGGRETLGDPEHALRPHLALVGTPERDRDHALAPEALPPRAPDDPLQPREGLLD